MLNSTSRLSGQNGVHSTTLLQLKKGLPIKSSKLSSLVDRMIKVGHIDQNSHITSVDDDSTDRTWLLTEVLARKTPVRFRGLKLSPNRGHQNAILDWLHHSPGDASITVDADLQADIEVIPEMVRLHAEEYEIVYGVRSERTTDALFERKTTQLYYDLLRIFGMEIVSNHADFRLMGRRSIDALKRIPETNLFLRVIIPQLGFRSTTVSYKRREHVAGLSKYTFRKMVVLAVNGITSFSVKPIRFIVGLGLSTATIAFALGLWAVAAYTFDYAVPGWTSIVVPIMVVSGLQIFSLGVIGEYVGRTYLETKRRPLLR